MENMKMHIQITVTTILLIFALSGASLSQIVDLHKNVPDDGWPVKFSQASRFAFLFECNSNDSKICQETKDSITKFLANTGFSVSPPDDKEPSLISLKVRISAYNLSATYVNSLGAYPMSLNTGYDVSVALVVEAQGLKPYEIDSADKQDPPNTSEWGVNKARDRVYFLWHKPFIELLLRMGQAERMKLFLSETIFYDQLYAFELWKKDLYPLILPVLNAEQSFDRSTACQLLSRWGLLTPEVIERMRRVPKKEIDYCSNEVLTNVRKANGSSAKRSVSPRRTRKKDR